MRRLLLVLPPVLGGISCGSSGARKPSDQDSRTDATDIDIESRLEIWNPCTVQEGDVRRIELDLLNKSPKKLTLRYTVDWFDQAVQRIVMAPGTWTTLELPAGVMTHVTIAGMPHSARSWRLRYAPAE